MTRTKTKKNHKSSPILENLMHEVIKETGYTKTLVNPEGEISMSDAISQIIAPYRQDATNSQSFHKLVAIACAAWNASILPANKRDEFILKMVTAVATTKQDREDFLYVIGDLMKRKSELFPHVSRMIIQYKVTDRRDDYHIAIASTLEK